MYKVNTFLPESPRAETTVSFSVSYLDWCEIEELNLWKDFERYPEEVQRQRGGKPWSRTE